jgi:hypothetical protein
VGDDDRLRLIFTFVRSSEEIDIQLKNRLERKRSNDTTSGGSNVTVIEGTVPDEIVERVCAQESTPKPAPLASCFFRRDSARASIKKKVRCSEAAEVIPPVDYFINEDEGREISHEDDDDVFSDSAPVQTPRGNMCTPYVDRKGSLPEIESLPDWFPASRLSRLFACLLHSLSVCSFHVLRPITWSSSSHYTLVVVSEERANVCLLLARKSLPNVNTSFLPNFSMFVLLPLASMSWLTARHARPHRRLPWTSSRSSGIDSSPISLTPRKPPSNIAFGLIRSAH